MYGQCGTGELDHLYWGRPEEYDRPHPCYKIDASKPGSDLAGETSASLSAASIAFKNANSEYSATLLKHAKVLYQFAKNHQGTYTGGIPDAGSFYKSWSGYKDELAWSAAWLFKATGENSYLQDAEGFYNEMQQEAGEFSWDNKGRGVSVLLSNLISGNNKYFTNAKDFCENVLPSKPKTPRGTIYIQKWGSNRHAGNVAFLCLVYGKINADKSTTDVGKVKEFGRDQINTMLGDESKGERSYVVGYGFNYPKKPHHRSSSCPTTGSCTWDQLYAEGPNPQILYGALVGGAKDESGNYVDDRDDYISNEVAVDYNAGFQSALAGLLSMEESGDCGN